MPFHVSTIVEWLLTVPAATHAVGAEHDTELRTFDPPGDASGLVATDQLAPFHISTSVLAGPGPLASPTAVQSDGATQEIPFSSLADAPGLSGGTIVHVDPFNISANVLKFVSEPTARHEVGPVHDTEIRSPLVGSLGSVASVQAEPFHVSAMARSGPSARPTATQAVGAVHDTPKRPLLVDAGAFGLDTIDQDEPFHTSVKVW